MQSSHKQEHSQGQEHTSIHPALSLQNLYKKNRRYLSFNKDMMDSDYHMYHSTTLLVQVSMRLLSDIMKSAGNPSSS